MRRKLYASSRIAWLLDLPNPEDAIEALRSPLHGYAVFFRENYSCVRIKAKVEDPVA